jgi:SAM-dependent methyltransferase
VLVDDPPGGPFDLIHCRAVLMHIPERRRALERMASWLAPGGRILCEEPDWAFTLTSPRDIWRRTFLAFQEALPTMDFACGRALVHDLAETGLEHVAADVEADVVRGDTDESEWYRLSMLALEEPVLGSGAMSEAEFEQASAVFDEPGFCEPGLLFVGAHGRRAVA